MANNRQQLVEELKALLEQDVTTVKEQVDHLKTQFYRVAAETADQAQETADQVAEQASQVADEVEEQFKALLNEYKAKRAAVAAEQAKEEEANLKKKQAILDEMKTLAEGETDGVMANLQRMRELQAEWKNIGAVPITKVQELRKQYQQYQEQFYDLVKINIELRDLDFKKNLEMKTILCEAAERLMQNENIVEASRSLQQLHEEWTEIGPVARELREDLWNRFKAASTAINKKHQEYFDQLHAREQENLQKKQAIIEQMKEIMEEVMPNGQPAAEPLRWEKLTDKVQALQGEWRTIGFAPKKFNQSIYDEYRQLCDAFYKAKTTHYKGLRDTLSENLQKKRSLIEQARELAESQDWQNTAETIRALQAEWKTVGPVARKYSDELWKEFSTACDTFFNAKREAVKESRDESRKTRAAKALRDAANQGSDSLRRMRDRLQQEIKTAENNILFFTAKSKTANKLVDSMQKKIDELKKQLDDIQAKIDAEE
ncbi:MAG: DUF349 domain-containing protein [Paludibacteraceae bacterium]|nr:DUF349 domain-containing protein [Paludibacteraceae bacterium]